ncbi:MAG: Bor family protein [Candidatus Cloacimonetes bacterium]|nr:Bor family protein [Candidatus Cloacimonadota bacterium]
MRKALIILMAAALLGMVACSTHTHIVGTGGQGSDVQIARQWYAIFGLVELNEVDTNAMASGATDYTITTEQTFVDGLITCFTSAITISCRSVEVTK